MTLLDLLEYVKVGGPPLAVVFCILWWLEREERQDAQKELKQVSEKSVVAISELKMLIGHLVTILKPNGKQ